MIVFNDQIAKAFNNPDKAKDAATFSKFVVDNYGLNSDSLIIDFGCGTGLVGLSLLSTVKHVVFQDTSSAMLDVLMDSIKANNFSNYTILNQPIDQYEGEKADFLVSRLVFHHVENFDETIKGIFNSLKPNGKAIIVDLCEEDGSFHAPNVVPFNGFDPKKLGNEFSARGFKKIDILEHPPLPKELPDGNVRQYERFILVASK